MKKLYRIIVMVVISITMCSLTACFNDDASPDSNEVVKQDITGVTFLGKSTTYNGEEQSIEISGTLPEGVTVTYTNSKATNTGTYNATAVLSGDGYNTLTLTATLTIVGTDITGVSFSDSTVSYDGSKQSIEISGTLPVGVSVSYSNNEVADVGVYSVIATISGDGYNTLTLTATLTIIGLDITGVTFTDKTVTYNNAEQLIEVSGDLPTSATVTYTNNAGTIVGEYNSTVIITAKGYNTLTLTAKLTILSADFSGISFETQEFDYTGEEITLVLLGAENLPSNAVVTYENNVGIEQGTYNAKVTITAPNYNTLVIEANLIIKVSLIDVAKDIISNVFSIPNPWDFLPEAFDLENRSASAIDYTSFVAVSSIPSNGIGKQLNVVYDALVDTQSMLKYVNIVNMSLTAITTAYQAYINENPNDYSVFSDTEGNLIYTIQLDGNNVEFLIKYLSIAIEFTYDHDTNTNICRVQLTDSNAIRYESNETSVSIATTILNFKNSLLVFDFSQEGMTNGWVYEFMGISSLHTTTEAFFSITENHTTVVSDKKDDGDYTINFDVEVYSNSTGELIGSEVEEKVATLYDTYWFNLKNISNINSIKVTDEVNADNSGNANTIYLNGSSTKFVEDWNTVPIIGQTSRKHDIEMRTQYFYNYNIEKEEYEKVSMLVPMLFVQTDAVDEFASGFSSNNGIYATLPSNYTLVNEYYKVISSYWSNIKGLVKFDDIINFIGSKDEWFNL